MKLIIILHIEMCLLKWNLYVYIAEMADNIGSYFNKKAKGELEKIKWFIN